MNRFRLSIWAPRLLWKLAASYLIITLTVVIVYVLVDVELEYRGFQSQFQATAIAARMQHEAPRFAPLVNRAAPNLPALEHLLFRLKHEFENRDTGLGRSYYFSLGEFNPAALSLAVLDQPGRAVLQTSAPNDVKWQGAAPFSDASKSLILQDESRAKMIAVPLSDATGEVQFFLLLRLSLPQRWWQGVPLANIVGELRSVDLLYMALMSLTFGYIIARQLTERLERISIAADAWARGDFAAVAEDHSADELGELSRRLNRMAQELREVVALRQNLAAAEERNRLARDLHDTVKQRAFALSMQIAAMQALLEHNPPAAQLRLIEAERLAHQIQQELVSILEELRPEGLRQQGLSAALRETLNDWSRQSGIPVETRAADLPPLPPRTQGELLRIVQEALANIARHSRANNVSVEWQRLHQNGKVSLTIRDDGCGFDPAHRNGGRGLGNMRERAEALPDGSFTIESNIHHGTRLEVQCATGEPQKG